MTHTHTHSRSPWPGIQLSLLLLASACHQAPEEEEDEAPSGPVVVHCEPARAAPGSDAIELRGVVHPPPDREVVVAALVAGRVRELKAHEGDVVHEGQLLATIEDPELAAGVTEAQAEAAAAAAREDAAASALARAQRLFEQGIAARREVDDARAAAASAQAASRAARARAGLAGAQRSRARVTAPMDGVVIRAERAPGDLVDGSGQTPIAVIADPSVLELRADVPAAALVRLRAETPAQTRLDALPGQVFDGHVTMVAPAVDEATGLGSVRVSLEPRPGFDLKIGLAGVATVKLADGTPLVVVPRGALRRGASGGYEVVVCATGADGRAVAEVRSVERGPDSGRDVVIQDGLASGERVVVDHVLGLTQGAGLVVAERAASGAPR